MTRLATLLLLATLTVSAAAQSDEVGPGYTVTEDTVEVATRSQSLRWLG